MSRTSTEKGEMKTSWDVNKIKVNGRFRKNLQDLDFLMKSIEILGLLHPIVIDNSGNLIAGERRLESCKRLGWKEIPVHIVKLEDVLLAQRDENTARSDFLLTELVAIERAIGDQERLRAKERQLSGLKQNKNRGGNFPQRDKGKSRDAIAAYGGVSGRTLEKAKVIVEAAEENPDVFGTLCEEMDRTKRVNGVYKKLIVCQKVDAIQKEPPPMPDGKFRVIVCDPPWHYFTRPDDSSHRAANPYPPLTIEQIKKLDVGSHAHADSILWLWTTNAHLPDSFSIVESWGFKYKTLLTWVKTKIGLGDWLRGTTEHCLMCVKGNPTIALTNESTHIVAESGRHSKKPDEFYQMVEKLCPGSKLEMYQREERIGWIGHGDEAKRL